MGAVRVLSKVANLASKSHFSNPCSSRYDVFYDFFKNFFKNIDFKKFQNVEVLIHVLGYCEGTLRGLRILSQNMIAQILLV